MRIVPLACRTHNARSSDADDCRHDPDPACYPRGDQDGPPAPPQPLPLHAGGGALPEPAQLHCQRRALYVSEKNKYSSKIYWLLIDLQPTLYTVQNYSAFLLIMFSCTLTIFIMVNLFGFQFLQIKYCMKRSHKGHTL